MVGALDTILEERSTKNTHYYSSTIAMLPVCVLGAQLHCYATSVQLLSSQTWSKRQKVKLTRANF